MIVKTCRLTFITHTLFIGIFFIFIGCAGTMSGNKESGGPFTINTTASKAGRYYILSIRDTGLVVAPANSTEQGFDMDQLAFIHKNNITSIKNISLEGLNTPGFLIGIPAGAIIGGLWGALLAPDPKPATNIIDGVVTVLSSTSELGSMMVGGLIGSVVGSFAGGIIFSPQSKFNLNNPADKEKLIYLCKYCGHEPDAVNAIR